MAVSPNIIDRLGKATIRQALQGETAERRANAVQKIGRDIRDATLSEADRAFATKLMDRICQDISDLVRRALAVTLRSSPHLPAHLALLAEVAEVAEVAVAEAAVAATLAATEKVQEGRLAERRRYEVS